MQNVLVFHFSDTY